jgi:hypothetical protein
MKEIAVLGQEFWIPGVRIVGAHEGIYLLVLEIRGNVFDDARRRDDVGVQKEKYIAFRVSGALVSGASGALRGGVSDHFDGPIEIDNRVNSGFAIKNDNHFGRLPRRSAKPLKAALKRFAGSVHRNDHRNRRRERHVMASTLLRCTLAGAWHRIGQLTE